MTWRRNALGLGFGAGLLMSAPAYAQPAEISLELGTELRLFAEEPRDPRQLTDWQPSLFIEPEVSWRSQDRRRQASFVVFARLDGADEARSHVDIRQAYLRQVSGNWDILVGMNRVFWGVTESRHLVNIINQMDAVEDIDEEDFLGQPMVEVSRQSDIGRFSVFVLPGFRERSFPGVDGRLRTGVILHDAPVRYENGADENAISLALRYEHFFGPVDIGVTAFSGTSREPDISLPPSGDASLIYPDVNQLGLDLQYTGDSTLLKLEAILREGQGDTFSAFVLGVEHTFYQIADSNADLGLVAEWLFDERSTLVQSPTPADNVRLVFPTSFDNDAFAGVRLALNDTQDTTALAGIVLDANNGLTSFQLEAERRFGERWFAEANLQLFFEDDPADPASAFERDSFVSLRLSRFF